MTSPFIFDVAELLRRPGAPIHRTQEGPSPERIGPEMIAIAPDTPVVVDATLTPLGDAVMVDADVTAQLTGECVRCLQELRPQETLHISEVYANGDGFIQGEDAPEGEDEDVPQIEDNRVDLLQAVIDAAGMTLPFNPTCQGECGQTEVPAPDGVSGEEPEGRIDPRWAGLEKFL